MGIVFAPGVFRLFLACLVVLSHVSALAVGGIAVMAFFILSGYWVSKMYQEKYILSNSSTIKFYFSRVFRIWPLYIFVTLVAAIAFNFMGHDVWLNFFDYIIFGLATVDSNISGVAWSLDIELQFYLFFPVLVFFLNRFGAFSALVLSLLVFLMSLYLYSASGVRIFAYYLPYFILGCAVYFFRFESSKRFAVLSVVCFSFIGLLLVYFDYTRPFLFENQLNPFPIDFIIAPWVLTLIPFIAYSVRFKWLKIDRDIGNLAYTLYLVHWPVIFIFSRDGTVDNKLIWVLVSFVISIVTYWFFEKPLERSRERIMNKLF